jgi:hypothetical protein
MNSCWRKDTFNDEKNCKESGVSAGSEGGKVIRMDKKNRVPPPLENAKVRPEPSYATVKQAGGLDSTDIVLLALAVLIVCVAFIFFGTILNRPDVWAQIDQDVSACIERGIDEATCYEIALDMAGVDVEAVNDAK